MTDPHGHIPTTTQFHQNFARKLRLARKEAGLTRLQLANLCEPAQDAAAVSQRIYKYETGATRVPLFAAWRLAQALHVNLAELCEVLPREGAKVLPQAAN